jgi:hypothetical protein
LQRAYFDWTTVEGAMRKVGLMIAALLGGCSSPSTVKPLRPLQIPTAPYQRVASSAQTGSLMYEAGCLLFRDENSGALLLPVWPAGSTFNGTAVLFHEPGKADQRLMVAEEFHMDGQPLEWAALTDPAFEPFQRTCPYQPFFVSRLRPAD